MQREVMEASVSLKGINVKGINMSSPAFQRGVQWHTKASSALKGLNRRLHIGHSCDPFRVDSLALFDAIPAFHTGLLLLSPFGECDS